MLIFCLSTVVIGCVLALLAQDTLAGYTLLVSVFAAATLHPRRALTNASSFWLLPFGIVWLGMLLTEIYPLPMLTAKQGFWESMQALCLGSTFLIYGWFLWKLGSTRSLIPGLLLAVALLGFLEETSWGRDWTAPSNEGHSLHELQIGQWSPQYLIGLLIRVALPIYGVAMPLCAFLFPSVRYAFDCACLPVGPWSFGLVVPLVLCTITGWDASEVRETTLYLLLLVSTIHNTQWWILKKRLEKE